MRDGPLPSHRRKKKVTATSRAYFKNPQTKSTTCTLIDPRTARNHVEIHEARPDPELPALPGQGWVPVMCLSYEQPEEWKAAVSAFSAGIDIRQHLGAAPRITPFDMPEFAEGSHPDGPGVTSHNSCIDGTESRAYSGMHAQTQCRTVRALKHSLPLKKEDPEPRRWAGGFDSSQHLGAAPRITPFDDPESGWQDGSVLQMDVSQLSTQLRFWLTASPETEVGVPHELFADVVTVVAQILFEAPGSGKVSSPNKNFGFELWLLAIMVALRCTAWKIGLKKALFEYGVSGYVPGFVLELQSLARHLDGRDRHKAAEVLNVMTKARLLC